MSLSGYSKSSLYGKGVHYGSTQSFSTAPKSGKERKGPLISAAKAEGLSLHAYAEKHKASKGIDGKRSRFYLNVIYKKK